MKDGRLNKCKECTKKDVKENREKNASQYAVYERKRFKTKKRKGQILATQRKRRQRNPEKQSAYGKVYRAIKNRTLKKGNCEVCGSPETQAHHEDYLRPLDVKWLCFKHHRENGHGQQVN